MANEKKCTPFDDPHFLPSWACCACSAKGSGTLNGNHRDNCKTCGHERCDNPPIKQVAFKEKDGVQIVAVNTDKKKAN